MSEKAKTVLANFVFVEPYLLSLVPYGARKNVFYSSGVGLASKEISVAEFKEILNDAPDNWDIVVPSHLFTLPNREEFISEIAKSRKKIWLQVGMESELLENLDFILTKIPASIPLQILSFHPTTNESFGAVEKLKERFQKIEIVYFPYHYSHVETFPDLISRFGNSISLGYLPKGHKRDPFFSTVEMNVDLSYRPEGLRVYVYSKEYQQLKEKGLNSSENIQFSVLRFHRLLNKIYWNPQLLLTPFLHAWYWLRKFWNPRIIWFPIYRLLAACARGFLALLFWTRNLVWEYLFFPLRKIYWFLDFQYRKRIKKDVS